MESKIKKFMGLFDRNFEVFFSLNPDDDMDYDKCIMAYRLPDDDPDGFKMAVNVWNEETEEVDCVGFFSEEEMFNTKIYNGKSILDLLVDININKIGSTQLGFDPDGVLDD